MNTQNEPFDWTRYRPGVFRSYAAPITILCGALLAIGLYFFA